MTVVRPAREEDVEAAAEMLNEHSRRLHGTDDMTPADLLMYWTSPDVELGQDVLLAESADGRLGGYADLGVHGDAVWLDVRGTDPATLPVLLEAIEQRAITKEPDKKLWGYTLRRRRPARRAVRADGLPQGAPLVPHADRPRRRSVRARMARRRLGPHDARGRGAPGLRGADGVLRGHVDVRSGPVRRLAALDGRGAVVRPLPCGSSRSRKARSRASSSRGRPRTSPASAGCASWVSCRSTASAAWGKRCSSTRSPSSRGADSRRSASESTPRTRRAQFVSTSGPGCTSSGRT